MERFAFRRSAAFDSFDMLRTRGSGQVANEVELSSSKLFNRQNATIRPKDAMTILPRPALFGIASEPQRPNLQDPLPFSPVDLHRKFF